MENKLNEDVGKKIVEALKKQSETPVVEENSIDITSSAENVLVDEVDINETAPDTNEILEHIETSNDFSNMAETVNDVANIEQNEITNVQPLENNNFVDNSSIQLNVEPNEIDLPPNIVILKKLISQLPSGVTRHTGAQIIKQTMEALGISMKSVLQEAQDVQDNLKESTKECQENIQEYRKQISNLEKQVQSYQKQYGSLNDLISLFIQTTK